MLKREQIQDQTQQIKLKEAEKQAINSLTSSLNSHDQFRTLLLKEFKDMKGTPQQKNKRLLNRLQKFFLKDAKINVKNGYFCKRRQPPYRFYQKQKKPIKLVDNQIIIFGIDFIKSRQIIKAYLPEDFQTIDMSHIKLIYRDFDHAMESLRRNMREDIIENEAKLEPNQNEPPKGWTQMRPYYFNNYERRLLARFATEEQRDMRRSEKMQSEIPEYAKRVYNLKKKFSQDIEENYQIRQALNRQKKWQTRSKRSQHGFEKQNQQTYNYQNRQNRFQEENDNLSEKSFTLKIGGRQSNQSEKSESNRERSRSRDLDDNRSVASKKSSVSATSLINKFDNSLNIQDKAESQSVVSDVSFILDQDINKDLFEDMAIRLGLVSLGQNNDSMEEDIMLSSSDMSNQSFSSSKSSSSRAYRRLTENMPDQPDQSFSNQSFTKKKWNYNEDVDRDLEEEFERKKQEKFQKSIIILDD